MNDTHYRIMQELRKYFEANQDWEMNQTHAAGMRARQHLAELRILARQRRAEIQSVRVTKPKIKSPKYREAKLKEQQAQIQQAKKDQDTN